MTEEQIKHLIKEKLLKGFREEETVDSQVYSILMDLEKLGYQVEFDTINEGEWVKDGDDLVLKNYLDKVIINNFAFYIKAEQRSSSSSEPYQYEPELEYILTEKEYQESLIKVLASFTFKNNEVYVYSNKKARILKVWFDSVELAITSLL